MSREPSRAIAPVLFTWKQVRTSLPIALGAATSQDSERRNLSRRKAPILMAALNEQVGITL